MPFKNHLLAMLALVPAYAVADVVPVPITRVAMNRVHGGEPSCATPMSIPGPALSVENPSITLQLGCTALTLGIQDNEFFFVADPPVSVGAPFFIEFSSAEALVVDIPGIDGTYAPLIVEVPAGHPEYMAPIGVIGGRYLGEIGDVRLRIAFNVPSIAGDRIDFKALTQALLQAWVPGPQTIARTWTVDTPDVLQGPPGPAGPPGPPADESRLLAVEDSIVVQQAMIEAQQLEIDALRATLEELESLPTIRNLLEKVRELEAQAIP